MNDELILTVSLTIDEDKFALSFDLAKSKKKLTERRCEEIFNTFRVIFAATLRENGRIVNPGVFD